MLPKKCVGLPRCAGVPIVFPSVFGTATVPSGFNIADVGGKYS